VDVIGTADVGMDERTPDTFRDGNVRPVQKFQHAQRILCGYRGVGVAEGCGKGLEYYAWPADGVENRHGVVDAGVDIDDHSARVTHVEVLASGAVQDAVWVANGQEWFNAIPDDVAVNRAIRANNPGALNISTWQRKMSGFVDKTQPTRLEIRQQSIKPLSMG
jgi:hypothetical protein